MIAYPGAYSGRMILYPKALKVKPIGDAAMTGEGEPSARNWTPKKDPVLDCLRPTDMIVKIAATPNTIANIKRNELPVEVGSFFLFTTASSEGKSRSPWVSFAAS